MSRRYELERHIPAAQLDRAVAVMDAAEAYTDTAIFLDGFPVGSYYLEAARALVTAGLLVELNPFRFAHAPSREFVL